MWIGAAAVEDEDAVEDENVGQRPPETAATAATMTSRPATRIQRIPIRPLVRAGWP
jgi:hypothetical protein